MNRLDFGLESCVVRDLGNGVGFSCDVQKTSSWFRKRPF